MGLNPWICNCERLTVQPVLLSGSVLASCMFWVQSVSFFNTFVLPVSPNKRQWNYRRLLVWCSLLSADDHWQQSAGSVSYTAGKIEAVSYNTQKTKCITVSKIKTSVFGRSKQKQIQPFSVSSLLHVTGCTVNYPTLNSSVRQEV